MHFVSRQLSRWAIQPGLDLSTPTTTVPAAFQAAAYPGDDLLAQVRLKCRQYLHAQKVLKRIPEDIAWIFDISGDTEETSAEAVGDLWDKDGGTIEGGKNYAGGD